jgi:tetratricopeptide (TPR) repeat protein
MMPGMATRVGLYAGRAVEAGWLLALIVAPLFFNPDSGNPFELTKLAALRSIVLVSVAAWLLAAFAARPRAPGPSPAAAGRPAVVWPVVLLVAVTALSTATSVAPRASLWGSYERLDGLYTTACFVALYFSIRRWLERPEQAARVVTTAVLVSLPVSLYGIVQRHCLDPVSWHADAATRVVSTLGNPNFLAAFLIMCVPLALARLVATTRQLVAVPRPSAVLVVRAAGYGVVLAVQVSAIVYSQSRAAWLGLLGGTFLFVLLGLVLLRLQAAAGARRARWLWLAWCIAGALLAGLIVVINLPGGPAGRPAAPRFGQLFNLAETEGGSGKVRLLIWQAAADLLGPHAPLWSPTDGPDRLHAWRRLVGYGPETLGPVYAASLPADLPGQPPEALADRSHNATFDSLVQTGLLGLLAYLGLFTSLVHAGLTGLGLIETRPERAGFLALWLGGAGLLTVALRLFDGSWRLLGVGLPVGMLAGLVVYVVAIAWRGAPRRRPAAHPGQGLLVALLSALVAHFIETQLSFATAATGTYFWSLAALLAVAAGAATRTEPSGERAVPIESRLAGPVVLLVVLVTLAWALTPMALSRRGGVVLLWLLLVTGLMGLALGLRDPGSPDRAPLGRGRARKPGLALAGWLGLYLALDVTALTTWRSPTLRLSLYYLAGLAVPMILLAVSGPIEPIAAPRPHRRWTRVAALALAGVWLGLVWATGLRVAQADVYYRQGATLHRLAGQLDAAVEFYERAVALAPDQDRYYPALARARLDQLARLPQATGAGDLLARADGALHRARDLAPMQPGHSTRLARFHEWRAARAGHEPERAAALAAALALYEDAARLHPRDAGRYSDSARVHLAMGQLDRALAGYRRAVALDAGLVEGYAGLRDVYLARARAAPEAEARRADLSRADEAARTALDLSARVAARPPGERGRCPGGPPPGS